eukprot:GILJ01007006.1.p1 GENE.GILJ01007006.1~~GILJ01007006.1.p1  ORF type:complete len:543 (-),score=104.26 GILJ01007006.1:34-1662(-)
MFRHNNYHDALFDGQEDDAYSVAEDFTSYLSKGHQAQDKPVSGSPENLDSGVKYIQQTLDAYGFPPMGNLFTSQPQDISATLNCIFALLRQRQADMEFRSDIAEKLGRLESDKHMMYQTNTRLQNQLASLEAELGSCRAKAQADERRFKADKDRIQLERDELIRLNTSLQHKDAQYQHELRKREREYGRLQEQLRKVLSDRDKESKAGMDLLNALQRDGGKRGTWKNNKKGEEDFYKMVVRVYETKQAELISENEELRKSLQNLQEELKELLKQHKATTSRRKPIIDDLNEDVNLEESEQGLDPTLNSSIDEAMNANQFNLPFDLIREDMEGSMRANMSKLSEYIQRLNEEEFDAKAMLTGGHIEQNASEHGARNIDGTVSAEIQRLKRLVGEYRKVVLAQDHLLKCAVLGEITPMSPEKWKTPKAKYKSVMEDEQLESARKFLDGQHSLIEEQQSHLKQERRQMTEAAVRLDEERMTISKERRDLELERLRWEGALSQPLTTDSPVRSRGLPVQHPILDRFKWDLGNHNSDTESKRNVGGR